MTPAILHSTGSKRARQESAGSWLPFGRRSTTEVSRKTGCKTAITPGEKQVFETSRTAIASKKQAHLLDRTVFRRWQYFRSSCTRSANGRLPETDPVGHNRPAEGNRAGANRTGQPWGTVRAVVAYMKSKRLGVPASDEENHFDYSRRRSRYRTRHRLHLEAAVRLHQGPDLQDRAPGSDHGGQRHRPDQAQDLHERGRHLLWPYHPLLCEGRGSGQAGPDRGYHRERAAGGQC